MPHWKLKLGPERLNACEEMSARSGKRSRGEMCLQGRNLRAPGGRQLQGRRLETSGKMSSPARSVLGSELQREVATWQGYLCSFRGR